MKNFIKLSFVLMVMLPSAIFAQQELPRVPILTLSGQVGYANPQGKAFKDADVNIGIGTDFDMLYHLEQLDRKLGVGVTFSPAFLFGTSASYNAGAYGQMLYGARAHYKFLSGGFSPYASLSVGAAQLSIPGEVDSEDKPIPGREAKTSGAFGLRPEIGLQMKGFIMSASYLVPMMYDLHGGTKKPAGSLQFSIGVRLNLWSTEAL